MFCILALFGLAAVLATFQKIGLYFPNHLVTLTGSFTNPHNYVLRGEIEGKALALLGEGVIPR